MSKPVTTTVTTYWVIEDRDPFDPNHPNRSSGICELGMFFDAQDAQEYISALRKAGRGVGFRIEQRELLLSALHPAHQKMFEQ
jgi:hypothetical protein